MENLATDPFWAAYEEASHAHEAAMNARLEAERSLLGNFSVPQLERWNTCHREEDCRYEELKAAERVVWAKYKSGTST